jgi:hypothetical protein
VKEMMDKMVAELKKQQKDHCVFGSLQSARSELTVRHGQHVAEHEWYRRNDIMSEDRMPHAISCLLLHMQLLPKSTPISISSFNPSESPDHQERQFEDGYRYSHIVSGTCFNTQTLNDG